ncbi:suppressor of fused domain protein [Actinomadura kijaniata]|uniref:suppressor of fused domain protein n=1 Tax=Actinomadura kijaniata TaxID=46161 RepID=UPI000836ADB3|nr:suppressor of fused domain protein [Actinomadura kijaniata]
MLTHSELVRVFGPDSVVTLDRDQMEGHGFRPEDAGLLCEVGLPVTAGILFTMRVDGPFDALSVFEAETPERPARFMVLGKGRTDDRIRYAMELESGNVLLLALEDGVPAPEPETINTSLGAFVEFLYRVELCGREMGGASLEATRPYVEKLITDLRASDERALAPDTFWSGLMDAYLHGGVPRPREGSRAAIIAALEAHLPEDEPLRWATGTPLGQGVQELSAHRADGYWLLVTWGFSDLDGLLDAESEPGVSGLGFELTMRVPRDEGDELPPGWALGTLRSLGEYVFGEGYPFADGHRMGVAGRLGPETSRLDALVFVTDPHLGAIDTPDGEVAFITAVGVTREELAEAKATGNDALLVRLNGANGVPVTDVTR